MGTSTIIDIITSAVIAGVLLLIALRLNAQANESTMVYNGSVILQQNITTLVAWIEHDFRQIGYCRDWTKIPVPSQAFRKADSSDITFWTDVNNNGSKDSIRWYIGPVSDAVVAATPNPRDRLIYRVVNNAADATFTFPAVFEEARKPSSATKFLLRRPLPSAFRIVPSASLVNPRTSRG